MFAFQAFSLVMHSPVESAIITRSSAYRISQGTPVRNSRYSASSTMLKSSGLITEPRCTPTPTPNSLLYYPLTRTRLLALLYMPWMTSIAHSSTPRLLITQQRTFLGTRSKAFSRSTKEKQRGFFAATYFSYNWWTIKMASVLPLPDTKPNCISLTSTMLRMRGSNTCSSSFMTWSVSLGPR